MMMAAPLPPYYPPPRRSFASIIFGTLASVIFGFSLMLNVYLGLAALARGADPIKQETLIEGESDQRVAVYPLHAVIGSEEASLFEKYLSAAEKDASIKAVVLDIDTPGGDVTASDEIYARIRKFKEKKNIPIVVTMGGLATSGGYYVSCAADYIYAQHTTLTGNIGVLWPRWNVHELADKWGVKETTIASDKTPFKNAGSMFQAERPEDIAYLQGLVNTAYDRFTTVVKEGRKDKLRNPNGSKPSDDISQIANGKAYTSKEALKLGLVDEMGYATDAYEKAAKLANLSKPMVVKYTRLPTLFEAFGASSNLASPSAKLNVNGVDVRLDRKLLQELATPRLMYLWRGE
jgi:protease-4